MASASRYCPSCLSSVSRAAVNPSRPAGIVLPSFLLPNQLHTTQVRTAVQSANAAKYKRKDLPASQKRKKAKTTYDAPDLKKALQFSLVDAMRYVQKPFFHCRRIAHSISRYLRAAEVGQPPTSAKYEIHLRLKTPKNGAVVRNRLRLPHPVRTDLKICVIAPADSVIGQQALAAGAHIVGEDEVFEKVKAGEIDFDRCICHQDSLAKLAKSGVARVLGPRGLMPSTKLGTVVKDIQSTVKDMVGGSEYRERAGVVRMSIGQLGFSAEKVQLNIRAFIESVRKDIVRVAEQTPKDIHEVVLSSTHGPGFSLNGEFRGEDSIKAEELATG